MQALELTHKVDTVAFDKTGTLTVGQPRLTAIHAFDGLQRAAFASGRRGRVLTWQQASARARAVASGAPTQRCDRGAAAAKSALCPAAARGPGRRALLIGSLRWMHELGADLSAVAALAESLQTAGATVSAGGNGDLAYGSVARRGLLAFGDRPETSAADALARPAHPGYVWT